MSSASAEWRRFRARASKTPYGAEDACLNASPKPLSLRIGPGKPRRLLYLTKESFLRVWSSTMPFPDDLAVFCQAGLPSRATCNLLAHHVKWAGRPIYFIGDLDPLDLTIFTALRSGGPELRSRPSAVPVRYLGINDRWLQLCRKNLRPTIKGLEAITIKMGATEREHFDVMQRVLPALDRLIGPECLAILQSGRKLELEGAGHPGLYR